MRLEEEPRIVSRKLTKARQRERVELAELGVVETGDIDSLFKGTMHNHANKPSNYGQLRAKQPRIGSKLGRSFHWKTWRALCSTGLSEQTLLRTTFPS